MDQNLKRGIYITSEVTQSIGKELPRPRATSRGRESCINLSISLRLNCEFVDADQLLASMLLGWLYNNQNRFKEAEEILNQVVKRLLYSHVAGNTELQRFIVTRLDILHD